MANALKTCLFLVLLSPVFVIGGCKAKRFLAARAAAKAQQERAEQEFQPALAKMAAAVKESRQAQRYDIDKTIRVIHEIDLGLKNKKNFKEYVRQVAMQDYRQVAPDVLESRTQLTGVLMKIYAKQIEADHQASAWDLTSNFLLTSVSSLKLDLGSGLTGGFGVDRNLVTGYMDDLKARHENETEMLLQLDKLDNELIDAVTGYAAIYHRYMDEWDQLCAARDHAYLAAHNLDWATVHTAADAAIERAPNEREAHLLKTMALIEQAAATGRPGLGIESGATQLQEALALLNQYETAHPGSTAPGLLLRGNILRQQGNLKEARNFYQHAASYYPKQAAELSDMLNPYAFRTFLRKSREGNYILHQYKSTMLGAGYFSPDLQMAHMLYDQGQAAAANAKVLDHFSRRRAQAQWDFVVADIEYCQNLMGHDYDRIFPSGSYIDLVINKSRTSSKRLSVSLTNRSDRDLHNCTLVLCLNFSDMHPSDYHTMTVGKTAPLLPAGETVEYGTAKLQVEILDQVKTAADIVAARSVLVANEAVIWADTDAYKVAKVMLEHRRTNGPSQASNDAPITRSTVLDLMQKATAEATSSLGKDDLSITLPKALAIMKPIFRLAKGQGHDEPIAPDIHIIDNDRIRLTFRNIANFDDPESSPGQLGLELYSPDLDAAAAVRFDRTNKNLKLSVLPGE